MKTVSYGKKNYQVDEYGFILAHDEWDEKFAQGMANEMGMGELTDEHRKVIRFIRDSFKKNGACPLSYETARHAGLFSRDFKRLFPAGYMRGACKMAGITYADRLVNFFGEERPVSRPPELAKADKSKSYQIDVLGYLLDPAQWDREFAINRAFGMKMGKLGADHWKIIDFLRAYFMREKRIPTVYETCEQNQLELSDLECLFPDGYNRGALRIAGLRPE